MKFKNSCDGFYNNSLDVRFTKGCDNCCSFCIEKKGIDGMQQNVEDMIMGTIVSGKDTVLILGGEPMLDLKKLLLYVQGIRGYVEKIYITTSLPKSILEDWMTFGRIVSLIDGLNVSLQHYNPKINNQILNATSDHNRIDLLAKICERKGFAKKVRVSINLVKGFIDTRRELDIFLHVMESINVKHVKINELQHTEDLYVSFENVYSMPLKSPYSHGCQTNIVLSSHDLKITLKRACFVVNDNLNATFLDLIKAMLKSFIKKESTQLVLYENGELSTGWKQKFNNGLEKRVV